GCRTPVVKNIIRTDASCGNADGSARIEMVGPNGDYTYTWTPNMGVPATQTGNYRTQLTAGLYKVRIARKDDPACFTDEEFVITNIGGPVISDVTTTPAICNAANGTALILPATYQYLWMYDNKITDFRNDLPAGSYTVRAMDPVNPNCPTMFMVEITSENNLQAEAEI